MYLDICVHQVAHQAGAFPGFCSMMRLGVFLLPPGWPASPSRGYPSIKFASIHLYTWMERGTVKVKCLVQEHNTMSPACSRVERTNHKATAPPQFGPPKNILEGWMTSYACSSFWVLRQIIVDCSGYWSCLNLKFEVFTVMPVKYS